MGACYVIWAPLETHFRLLMILKSVSMGRKTEWGTGEGGMGVCPSMLGGANQRSLVSQHIILTVLSDTQQSLSI
jgi:hypothetical protein